MSKFHTVVDTDFNLSAVLYARIVPVTDTGSHVLAIFFNSPHARPHYVKTNVAAGEDPQDLRSILDGIAQAAPSRFAYGLDAVVAADAVRCMKVLKVVETGHTALRIVLDTDVAGADGSYEAKTIDVVSKSDGEAGAAEVASFQDVLKAA